MTDGAPGGAGWVRLPLTRRTVLKGLGLGAAAAYAELELPGMVRAASAASVSVPRLTVEVVRPDDLMRLTFRLTNFVLDTSVPNQPRLVRGGANVTPLIAVDLGPQHVVEQALLTKGTQSQGNNQTPPAPPLPPDDTIVAGELPPAGDVADARLASSSRLVFALPGNVQSIPFTLAGLLDWNSLVPQVVPVAGVLANPFKVPPIRKPNANETAIEAPWWLVLSPSTVQAWAHAVVPVTHNGRTELWHTRLAQRNGNAVDEARADPVRAVWASDPAFAQYLKGTAIPPSFPQQLNGPFPQDGMPFRMAYTPEDRVNAVKNTSDWKKYNPQVVTSAPPPFATKRLMLSSLGAYVDIDGVWTKPNGNSLIEWRHRATLGRDHYVRLVNKGHLHPFGHRAVLVRETTRKFVVNNDGKRGAYLHLKFFIVVTEPVRSYPGSPGLDHEGRAFPFEQLEVLSRVSPPFASSTQVGPVHAFQPDDANGPILLTFRGTDWDGNTATFAAPFVFVEDRGQDEPYDPQQLVAVNTAYAQLAPNRRRAALQGQGVAFAAPSPGQPGNTTFPVQQLVFDALQVVNGVQTQVLRAAGQLAAFPKMAQALINLPDVEKLVGVPGLTTPVQFPQQFLAAPFGQGNGNVGEAFLEMLQPVPLPFGGENAGGLVNPKQQLQAITRNLGPTASQLADIAKDTFDPQQIFNDATAKILGGIPLKEILAAVNGVAQDAERAMKYVKDNLPTEVVIRFKWKPQLAQDPFHIFEPLKTDPKTDAFIDGEARQSTTDPNNRSWKVHGEITTFKLHLIGDDAGQFLQLDIAKLAFTSASGQKTTIDVKVDKVTFQGPLQFVDTLRKYLPIIGDALDSIPVPQAITASMGVAIPSVAVGVFQLSNVAFAAQVTIPLNGDPVRVRFAFSSRENPFTLTISSFGGGGFVALGIGADGVELLEIQFDFAGTFVIDIGIAQGGVEIRAGTYLKLQKSQNPNNKSGLELVIEGFLKLHGNVNVLGIVSVTIDVYLSLQYVHKDGPPAKDIASGRAKVSVKISILFFNVTLAADVSMSFGGDPKDPTFAQTLTSNDWADYAAAFAAVP